MSVRVNASNEGLRRTTSLPSPTNFTIAGWIKRRGSVTGNPFGSITSMLNSDLTVGIGMSIPNGGTNVTITSGSGDVEVGVNLTLDTWYYFALGCDGTLSDSLRGWIIKEDLTVYTIATTGITFTPANINLLNISGVGTFLDAVVANVMVWDSKLTTSNLLAQMVTSNPQLTAHLWTPLNVHTNLNDLSGNSRHWTSIGGTLSTESNPTVPYTSGMDLVSHTSTIKDITVTENEIISLDLVSYSNTYPALTIIENEIVILDLVSQSSVFNQLDILENELVSLDMVSYSYSFMSLEIVVNEIVPFDLVSYSSEIKDLTLLENEIVSLDLVSYSLSINDLELLEQEIINLDLISFSSQVYAADLIEPDDISMDLVEYSSVVYDLEILDGESFSLPVVLYSTTVKDMVMTAQDVENLDLVLFTSVINNITLDDSIQTPIERIYPIQFESRYIRIDKEPRVQSIEWENRTYLIKI